MDETSFIVHAAQLFRSRLLTLVDLLYTITERGLTDADIFHQPLETTRLDRRGLVAAPHGAVECEMPFDHASAQGHSNSRRNQAHLMTRITDGSVRKFPAQGLDHF